MQYRIGVLWMEGKQKLAGKNPWGSLCNRGGNPGIYEGRGLRNGAAAGILSLWRSDCG